MSRVELVFRSVGERSAELSLELAIANIRPERVHVIDHVMPFAEAVNQQLRIAHDCDQVVYVDADCLILEDLRPFLDANTRPYVDCYVSDRFRGRLHCGVHITRIDVVRAMAKVEIPDEDHAYVLRPESWVRNQAMRKLGLSKVFRNFNILHDYFQSWRDIFHKYALRELRSRTDIQRPRLEHAMRQWGQREHPDFRVARFAVEHAREHIPNDAPVAAVDAYIRQLFQTADRVLPALNLPSQPPFVRAELDAAVASGEIDMSYEKGSARPKVFGLGLSRTGTRSLTIALQIMGYDVVHYPIDDETFEDLAEANYAFRILEHYDGITDITVSPFYAELDRTWPDAKFILTTRSKEAWLRSCRNHWYNRPAFPEVEDESNATHMKIRRLLRAATYGTYAYNADRFSQVYDQHVRNVQAYFADKPGKLLTLDICGGEGWEKLAPFLSRDVPNQSFPHKGKALSAKLKELEVFD